MDLLVDSGLDKWMGTHNDRCLHMCMYVSVWNDKIKLNTFRKQLEREKIERHPSTPQPKVSGLELMGQICMDNESDVPG